MMTSISGERGVGKTLFLAERVYKKRKQGYFCVTNFSHAFSNLDCTTLNPEEFLDEVTGADLCGVPQRVHGPEEAMDLFEVLRKVRR